MGLTDDGGRTDPDGLGHSHEAPLAVALRRLELIRAETRAEIGLVHDRVNSLLSAEAFLTIAYAASMSNGTAWGKPFALVVAPVLAVLGLLLAVSAGIGIGATARIVLQWTLRQQQLLVEHPELVRTVVGWAAGGGSRGRPDDDQRRGLLFFRAVPVLFSAVWVILLVVALVVEH
jgi:hypothetical protein